MPARKNASPRPVQKVRAGLLHGQPSGRRHLPVLLALLLLCALPPTQAQDIPLGTWRTHAAYGAARTLAVTPDRVYAAAPGSLFALEREGGQPTPLSRLDGFSETSVCRMAYVPAAQTLLLAYENGVVDLLQGSRLYTVRAVAQAPGLPENRRAAHICVAGPLAYLSYAFGVVVLDVAARRVSESYVDIGPGGTALAVRGAALAGGNLYLATPAGVLAAPAAGANLQDFAAWQRLENLPAGEAVQVAAHKGSLYAAFAGAGLYEKQDGGWRRVPGLPDAPVLFLKESQGRLLAGQAGSVAVLADAGPPVLVRHPLVREPQEAEFDGAGTLWIADARTGLIGLAGGGARMFAPNGPVANRFARLGRWQADIVALPGGPAPAYAPRLDSAGFSVFTAAGWQNATSGASDVSLKTPLVRDVYATAHDPATGEVFVASFGDGLLRRAPGGPWQRVADPAAPPRTAAITGLATDAEGTLWVAAYGGSGPAAVYARPAGGAWRTFPLADPAASTPGTLLLDAAGRLWMPQAAGGIWVFDPAANRGRYLSTAAGSGGLPDNRVLALALDGLGQVWAGTARGAAYFFNPEAVLDNGPFDAVAPVFDGRPLLRDEAVTAIRTDGGDRKWFGTRNGAWLFDAGLTRQLAHFTAQNTPLLSDNVLDLEIQPVSGEVFFATDAGLVSYRGEATGAGPAHGAVRVFPNPVRPGFAGTVGIAGLAANCVVKITDAAGRLVFETRANGGTATWHLRDYTGRRAGAGVYLIFASADDGTERLVTKLAVVE